jgi:hypothetical protein
MSGLIRNDESGRTVDRLLASNLPPKRFGVVVSGCGPPDELGSGCGPPDELRSRGQVADLTPALSHTRTVKHTAAQHCSQEASHRTLRKRSIVF